MPSIFQNRGKAAALPALPDTVPLVVTSLASEGFGSDRGQNEKKIKGKS